MLIDDDRINMLDLDTLAGGEAALDLANLLVHFDVVVALGLPVGLAQAMAGAFIDPYRPSSAVAERIPAQAARSGLA